MAKLLRALRIRLRWLEIGLAHRLPYVRELDAAYREEVRKNEDLCRRMGL